MKGSSLSESVASQMAPPEGGPPVAHQRRLVGVQFRRAAAMIYDFDAGNLELKHDARVVVESERGEAIGWTVGTPEAREPLVPDAPLRRVLRVATEADHRVEVDHQAREREALRFCAQRARQLSLPMKLIACDWSHSGNTAAFYFSSDDRVDFRALVRELAQRYRVRVEMRQVGPRDEAKIIGAMGPCGRETCCSSWMRAFTPVSIKMAKDQGLALNPQKVMGVCGRLLCCLAYEQDTYRDLRRKLPRFGKQVLTPKGPGRVIDVYVLRGRVRVVVNENEVAEFPAAELKPFGGGPLEDSDTETESDSLPEAPEGTPAPVESKPQAPTSPPAPPQQRPRQDRSREQTRPLAEQRPQQQRRPDRPHQSPPPAENRHHQPPREQRPQQEQQNRQPRQEQPRQQQKPQQPKQQQPRPPRPPAPPKSAPMPVEAAGSPAEAAPASQGAPQAEAGQQRSARHRRRRRGRGPSGGGGNPNDEGSDSE